MTPKTCPECGRSVSWRNAALQCIDCGREYCKECPDYTLGRFDVGCPDCGCGAARPLLAGDDAGTAAPPLDGRRGEVRRGRNRGRRWSPPRPFRPGPRRRPPARPDAPPDRPDPPSSPFSF